MPAPADPAVGPDVDLDAPVAPARAGAWREAVLGLRYGERRRVFPTRVHVGSPGGVSPAFEVPRPRRGEAGLDHALRADVLAALLDRSAWHAPLAPPTPPTPDAREARSPVAWVTRSGVLGHHDEDADWLGAARAAFAEAGLALDLAVVTHAGWYDPLSGVGRRWRRLRRR